MAPLFTTGQDEGLQGHQTTQHVTQPSAGMLTGKTCHRGCRMLKSRHVVGMLTCLLGLQTRVKAGSRHPLQLTLLDLSTLWLTTRTRATRPTAQNSCDGELRVTSTVEPPRLAGISSWFSRTCWLYSVPQCNLSWFSYSLPAFLAALWVKVAKLGNMSTSCQRFFSTPSYQYLSRNSFTDAQLFCMSGLAHAWQSAC